MVDEHLAVGRRPCADPDRRHRQCLGDALGYRGRNGFEHDREAARCFERERVLEELPGLIRRAALRLEAAEHGRRLRGQADMAHYPDARAADRVYA